MSSRWLLALLLLLSLVGVVWYASQTGWMLNKPAPVVVSASVEAPVLDKPQVLESPLPALNVAEAPVASPEPVKSVVAAVNRPATASNQATNLATNNAPIQLLLRLESALRTVPTRLEPATPALSSPSPNRVAAAHPQAQQANASTTTPPVPERLTGSTPNSLSLRQLAVQETLAQAQSLWAAGSRSAALDLMREAVAVTERAQSGLTSETAASVLAPLVRELVRMELAEGRVSAVLEVLMRLEPALSGQSDLWAVRGNTAQRLGRHAESVRAYQMALKLRPGEPRWLLGAAVSLAAQGQLTEAAELAEAARAIGSVSPEILAYLRQAGVALR
jgi:MSHA biogenesis protein MshN